jgi:hypothetical protein
MIYCTEPRRLARLAGSAAASLALAAAALPALAQDAGPTPPDAVFEFTPIEPGSGEGLTIGFTQLGARCALYRGTAGRHGGGGRGRRD